MLCKRKVDCPHCGNEMVVSNYKDTAKCYWCKRLMSVKFDGNGKKAKITVEAIDFPPKERSIDERSYDSWKEEDIYGD